MVIAVGISIFLSVVIKPLSIKYPFVAFLNLVNKFSIFKIKD